MDARVSLALRRARRPLRGGRAGPVSVDSLAARLKLTPKRLAEAVDDLARLGFVIESHPMLGLLLVAAPPQLLAEEIACELSVRRVGRQVRCMDSTASTNDLAWEWAGRGGGAPDGLAVFAEHQSAGRGRRGNRWLSAPHASILGSVVLWMPQSPALGALLTRAAAVAVARAVVDQGEVEIGIKWPNDLVIEDRKVGGILVEARPARGELGPVVIGIGLNCSQCPEAFPPEIRGGVTSLGMAGLDVDRTLLARSLLVRLDEVAAQTTAPGGAAEVQRDASAMCRTLGRRISIREGETTYSGEVIGLDPDYGLVLRLAEGGIRRFPAMTAHVVVAQ
jgi:BirA family biotin operon repressor/biotin-[acetyl-CoA-carboxylase] ligase